LLSMLFSGCQKGENILVGPILIDETFLPDNVTIKKEIDNDK